MRITGRAAVNHIALYPAEVERATETLSPICMGKSHFSTSIIFSFWSVVVHNQAA